ncbi:UNVERIFIED_CONTAM: hypothetical protein K2H54_001060 [Gekko kuhli]
MAGEAVGLQLARPLLFAAISCGSGSTTWDSYEGEREWRCYGHTFHDDPACIRIAEETNLKSISWEFQDETEELRHEMHACLESSWMRFSRSSRTGTKPEAELGQCKHLQHKC